VVIRHEQHQSRQALVGDRELQHPLHDAAGEVRLRVDARAGLGVIDNLKDDLQLSDAVLKDAE